MSLTKLAAADAAARLHSFSAIIDARSPAEFAQDHLPGAVNWPTLDDEQRRLVGTEYQQISAFEARKRGAVMAARNIAAHLERESDRLVRGWRPLVYCWRGGQRSGALGLVLSQIGFDVHVLDGGYRAFRRLVLQELEQLPAARRYVVLCGKTGSGKSRLLRALAEAGAQVLDLEALASHRGSVLGALPGGQPSQKRFETALWDALRSFRADAPVFVESESRTIGRLRIPEALLARMRASPCVAIDMPLQARIDLLLADYPHHLEDVQGLCERLQSLRELRGAAVVDAWQGLAHAGAMRELVHELLDAHYDPIYQRSMARNFVQLDQARVLHVADGSAPSMARAARELLHTCPMDQG